MNMKVFKLEPEVAGMKRIHIIEAKDIKPIIVEGVKY